MSLPPLEEFNGQWQPYEDLIYQIFVDEVVKGGLRFDGERISCQRRPEQKGKHYAFWHLITSGRSEEERSVDLRRCERIRWIAWTIQNVNSSPLVSAWENRRATSRHVVLWVEAHDYAVILARRCDHYLLKTAYVVEPHRAKSFRSERQEYLGTQKG